MRHLGLIAAVLFFLLLSGVVFVFYGLPHLIRPELIRRQIIAPLEVWTGTPLRYNRFQFSYFPRFKVSFFDVQLASRGNRPLKVQAETVEVEPDSFPLLIKQFRVRHFRIQKAAVELNAADHDPLEVLKLKDVNVEALPLGTLKALKIHTEGDFTNAGGYFSGDFLLNIMNFSSWDWHSTALRGSFQMATEDAAGLYREMHVKSPLTVKEGAAHIKIKIEKEKGRGGFSVLGELGSGKLVYELPRGGAALASLPMDAVLSFESSVDFERSEWSLQRSRLTLPLGAVEISGHGKIQNGEIEELRFSAPAIQLEQIPSYLVSIKDALPFNIGFSGPGQLEMSLKGSLDKVRLYLNTDLSASVLTYGRLLDKPKGVPFTLALEAHILKGSALAGDLSIRFNEVLTKGTIKNLDFKTGRGQINLITNKHPVANWGPLVPALKGLKLDGNMKLLANWEGDLRNLANVKKVFNWTLERGSVAREDGAFIKGIQLDVDYDSGMGLAVKQAEAQIGEDRLQGQFSILNPGLNPAMKIILSAPEIHGPQVLKILGSLWPDAGAVKGMKPFLAWAEKPKSRIFQGKNFVFESEFKNKRWHIEKLGLDTEEGHVSVQGELLTGGENPSYKAHLEIDKAGLSILFPPEHGREVCRGKLSVDGNFLGNTLNPEHFSSGSSGEGSLVVTGAEFLTMDLFETLSKFSEFAPLKKSVIGKSVFDDVRGHFRLENGKFLTEDLVFLSPDFSIDSKGELSLEGQLNFRLELYLARAQAAKVIGQKSETMSRGEGEWFGPVPLFVTGSMAKPELKADPQLTSKLLTEVQRGKTQGAFRNFLREETLFAAARKS